VLTRWWDFFWSTAKRSASICFDPFIKELAANAPSDQFPQY
jgi:hypothetical protein